MNFNYSLWSKSVDHSNTGTGGIMMCKLSDNRNIYSPDDEEEMLGHYARKFQNVCKMLQSRPVFSEAEINGNVYLDLIQPRIENSYVSDIPESKSKFNVFDEYNEWVKQSTKALKIDKFWQDDKSGNSKKRNASTSFLSFSMFSENRTGFYAMPDYIYSYNSLNVIFFTLLSEMKSLNRDDWMHFITSFTSEFQLVFASAYNTSSPKVYKGRWNASWVTYVDATVLPEQVPSAQVIPCQYGGSFILNAAQTYDTANELHVMQGRKIEEELYWLGLLPLIGEETPNVLPGVRLGLVNP